MLHVVVLTPRLLLILVWPLPLSLATTRRISFDFSSSGYLDVSVPQVPLINLFDSVNDLWFFIIGVPAFGYLRIKAYLQLPVAFRSLSRPSSAPNAKAFSICSSSLELPSVYYLHNIGCSLLAWIAVIILYSYLSFFWISRFSKIVSFTCFDSIRISAYYGKTWFLNLLINLVSLYFCLSCMKTNFFVSFIRFSMNIDFLNSMISH